MSGGGCGGGVFWCRVEDSRKKCSINTRNLVDDCLTLRPKFTPGVSE